MSADSQERTVPPWLYKLFTGHQYPYVRRLAKFEKKDRKRGEMSAEPSREEIDAKFWEVYPRSSARILQEVKQGMIVGFTELGGLSTGRLPGVGGHAGRVSWLREYGRKKNQGEFFMTETISSARSISKSEGGPVTTMTSDRSISLPARSRGLYACMARLQIQTII